MIGSAAPVISGVTTAPATPAICSSEVMRGGQTTEFTVFKRKNRPSRQQNVPYLGQLSDRSTRKIFRVEKAPAPGAPNGNVKLHCLLSELVGTYRVTYSCTCGTCLLEMMQRLINDH